MSCIKWRWIGWGVRCVGAVLMVVGAGGLEENFGWLIVVGLIIGTVGFCISFYKWRCPSCDRHISESSPIMTTHCPYCGEELD